MYSIPKELVCKAYLVNNMPDKIIDDLLECVAGNAELANMAFKYDYADLACKLAKKMSVDMMSRIEVVGPATVAKYGECNGNASFIWKLAIKSKIPFQASIAVTDENSKVTVPHLYITDGHVNVTNHGYVAYGDGWNLTVEVEKRKLMDAVVRAEEFPIGFYNKKFEAEVIMARVTNGKMTDIKTIYEILGKDGIALYLQVSKAEATREVLDIIARSKPDEITVIAGVTLSRDRFDPDAVLKLIGVVISSDDNIDIVCKLMEYLCSISHLISIRNFKVAINKKAEELIKVLVHSKPHLYTPERFRLLAAAFSAFLC
jgi:hypothetical protein